MKFLTVAVACLFSIVQAGLITEEQKAKIMKFHAECLKESGVDESLALKAKKGDYTDDPKLKAHIFCFNKKAGFQNDAGELQVDFIKSKINDIVKDSKKTDELVEHCNIKKDTPEETAFAVVKCFHEFTPGQDFME